MLQRNLSSEADLQQDWQASTGRALTWSGIFPALTSLHQSEKDDFIKYLRIMRGIRAGQEECVVSRVA